MTALIFVLFGAGFFPNVVFCVGDDGHQAVEFASEGCCHPGAMRDLGCTGSDHCASQCKDIRLTAEATLTNALDKDLARDGIAKISTVALISTATLPASLTEAISLQGRASARGFLAPRERHTTVQLC